MNSAAGPGIDPNAELLAFWPRVADGDRLILATTPRQELLTGLDSAGTRDELAASNRAKERKPAVKPLGTGHGARR